MSKRKRTFQRGGSYHDTAIPCGNPKRMLTGEVLPMPSSSSSREKTEMEDVETEGERHLKVMVQKQLKTNFSVQELLSQKRQFAEAGRYKPVTKEIRGMLGLQEYQAVAKGDQRVEVLRQYGLRDDEIRLQLTKEGVIGSLEPSVSDRSTLGADPLVEREQLAAIETRMKDKEASLNRPDTFRDQKHLSRQQMDLEKSLFQGTQRDSSTLQHLLTSQTGSVITGDPSDPVNQLPALLAEVEERAREKIREKRRKRRKNKRRGGYLNDDDSGKEPSCDVNEDENDDNNGVEAGCLTLEEMIALRGSEQPSNIATQTFGETDGASHSASSETSRCQEAPHRTFQSEETSLFQDTCHRTAHSHARSLSQPAGAVSADQRPEENSERRVLRGNIEFIPTQFIQQNRLSAEEIRKLPKFENYETGPPNNVLYVKNLSPRVSEQNLVSLFGRFQKEAGSEVVYKLMTGRMRGQAFITFHSTEVATEALEVVNGFTLHGKPVIVQYGKHAVS